MGVVEGRGDHGRGQHPAHPRRAPSAPPSGTFMLLWPCWWSIALAAPPGAPPDGRLRVPYALFAGGALLLRGAGCTVNDLWDRKLDKKVARTANRPLARGAVSPRGAVAALAAQLTAGLAILTQLNPFSIALGAASLPLVVAYPLAKRVTDWVRGGGGFREC